MDINDLGRVVLMFMVLGILVGVAVITWDKFGDAAKTTETVTQQVTTGLGYAATLAQDDTVVCTVFTNGTITGTIGDTVNCTSAGALTTSTIYVNGTSYNVTYTYKLSGQTTTSMTDMINATTPITTSWVSLLVVVIILAIVIGIVLNSFAFKQR